MPENASHLQNTDDDSDANHHPILLHRSSDNMNIAQPRARHKLVFYPPGGAFNKKRASEQRYFTQLLDAYAMEYTTTRNKASFIQTHILDQFPEKCAYEYVPKTQKYRALRFDAAYQRIAQKLRDRLKVLRKQGGSGGGSISGGKSKKTTNAGMDSPSELCSSSKPRGTANSATRRRQVKPVHDDDEEEEDDDDDDEKEEAYDSDLETIHEPHLREEEEEDSLNRNGSNSNKKGNVSSYCNKKIIVRNNKRCQTNHSRHCCEEKRTTTKEDLVLPSCPCCTSVSVLKDGCEYDDDDDLPTEKIKDRLIIHLREEVEHLRHMATLMQQKIQVLEQLANISTSMGHQKQKRKKRRHIRLSSLSAEDRCDGDWSPSPITSNKRCRLLRSPSLTLQSLAGAAALQHGMHEEV